MTTTIDTILNSIDVLEDILDVIKNNLIEFKAVDEKDEEQVKSFEFPIEKLAEAAFEFKSLRRTLRRVYKQSKKYDRQPKFSPENFGFSFDFGHLGETIENTIRSAFEGLEEGLGNLDDFCDIDFGSTRRKKVQRNKVNPGTGISYGAIEYQADEVLPNIEDISNGLRILELLSKSIMSEEDLASELNSSKDDLSDSVAKLVESGLLLREKSGKQRFMLTRRGKQLKNLSEKEETNN